MPTKAEVYASIEEERSYQDMVWGTVEQHSHTLPEWLIIMRRKIEDAEDAWYNNRVTDNAMGEVIQAVATGVACLEQHGISKRLPLGGWVPVRSEDQQPDQGLRDGRQEGA